MSDQLNVKELAMAMRVGVTFVYQMRARGFRMRGPFRRERTATLREAIGWVRRNDFRLVDGRGVIRGDKPCPCGRHSVM